MRQHDPWEERMRVICWAVIWFLASLTVVHAEIICVKSHKCLDITPFVCTYTVSRYVHRVCYDVRTQYMLILLKNTWYQYCEIDEATVNGLLSAESKGRYYNGVVKGNFDCQVNRVPSY